MIKKLYFYLESNAENNDFSIESITNQKQFYVW